MPLTKKDVTRSQMMKAIISTPYDKKNTTKRKVLKIERLENCHINFVLLICSTALHR